MTARSLSQRIRDDIEHKIVSGIWLPGDRIPVEHDLAAQYGCARMTVTRATEALADAGLIVRRKRAGSFVARPRVDTAVLGIPDLQADIVARGMRYGYRLISKEEREPGPDADERRLANGAQLLALESLHLGDGRPFALERRLISLATVPAAIEADFATIAPGNWLLDHVPWTAAEHRIGAASADAEVAKLLNIEHGAPCLVLDRRTWRGPSHVTHARQIFPGGAFDLVARFTPGT